MEIIILNKGIPWFLGFISLFLNCFSSIDWVYIVKTKSHLVAKKIWGLFLFWITNSCSGITLALLRNLLVVVYTNVNLFWFCIKVLPRLESKAVNLLIVCFHTNNNFLFLHSSSIKNCYCFIVQHIFTSNVFTVITAIMSVCWGNSMVQRWEIIILNLYECAAGLSKISQNIH